ncbi:MAG: hypothetical protein IPM53_20705 [Anaerolineaceae bacterium]|nr:hypothetical protein [Anaerolineaceae bacterium]
MKRSPHRIRRLLLFLVGGAMPVTLTIGIIFHLPPSLLTVVILVLGLILAAMWLWYQANLHATGDEWWQDDQASGWRGY